MATNDSGMVVIAIVLSNMRYLFKL
jgi:hypothetical protein